ncbi:MAG TPA: ABC transporter ATP-binding protein, partial [Candidatus Paceibacterota bacterium]
MKQIKNLALLFKNISRSFALSIKYSKWPTILMSVTLIIVYVLPLLQSKILGDIIDQLIEVLQDGTAVTTALYLVLGYAGAWVATRLAAEVRLFMDKRWLVTFEQGLEMRVLQKRTELDLATHEDPKFQDLLQRAFHRGIFPIWDLVDRQFRNIANVTLIILSSVIASSISWQLYLVAVVSAIPTFVVRLKFGAKQWGIWSENSPRRKLYDHVRNHIKSRTGIMQNKLLQANSKLLGIADGILGDFRKEQQKVDRSRLVFAGLANLVAAAGFGFGLYILVQSVASGEISPGTLVFIVGVLGGLVNSVNQLLETIAEQYEKNLYATDIFTFLDTPSKIQYKDGAEKLGLTSAPTIAFENVSFKYDGRDDMILKNVSFEIKPGEHIALVGENGAGKSTLIKLLMRIYDPTEGRILVNRIDLRDIDHDEWVGYVSVLFQKYMLHDFKIADAIAMGRSDIELSEDLAKESADQSGAHDFIADYKFGYQQQLGKEFEGGIEPSQGQEQKIALA